MSLVYPKYTASNMNWPHYSSGLTLSNVLVWYFKDKVYHTNMNVIKALEQHISAVCDSILAVAFARASDIFVLHVVTMWLHVVNMWKILSIILKIIVAICSYSYSSVFPLISVIYFEILRLNLKFYMIEILPFYQVECNKTIHFCYFSF